MLRKENWASKHQMSSETGKKTDTETISLLQAIYREDGRFTLRRSHKMTSGDALRTARLNAAMCRFRWKLL